MGAVFYAALVGSLAAAMGSFAGRALLALGFGAVTYTGITFGIESLKETAISGINSLPADALNLAGFLWIDKALTVVFSATSAALAMRAVGGTVKKLVMK